MEAEKDEKLNSSEVLLRAPDAVLEPNILAVLRRYVSQDGGKPVTAIEELSDNFVGYAHMASLVCKWLQQTENPMRTPGANDVPQDEAYFLKEVIKSKFDAEKLDSVLRSRSHTPSWVTGLTSDRIGRQLIYDLSGVHKNSLMLNFAVQKILADGHDQEVAGVGSSLAGYFGVYHRTVASRLKKAVGASSRELEMLTSELKESTCQGEHTYLHAQQLLSHLSRSPNGSIFRRMSEDLESHAARTHGGAVWRLQPSFETRSSMAEPDHRSAAYLAAEMLAMQTEKKSHQDFPMVEMERLSDLYAGSNPPSFGPVRHPQMLSILLKSLVSQQPGNEKQQQQHTDLVNLLARIVSANDNRPSGGALDLSQASETASSIEAALELCSEAARGKAMSPQAQHEAEQILCLPIAASSVLASASGHLQSSQKWREMATHQSIGTCFHALMAIVIPRQPLLLFKAADLIVNILKAIGNTRPAMAQAFLDLAALVLQHGEVERVLYRLSDWARTADPSLMRHFIFKVLEACAPPYSVYFASSLITLMCDAGIRLNRPGMKKSGQADLLKEFAEACNPIDFAPPLSNRDAKFLHNLQTERIY